MKTLFRPIKTTRTPKPGEFFHVEHFGVYLCAESCGGVISCTRLTDGACGGFTPGCYNLTIVVPVAVEQGILVFEPAP